MAKRWIFYLAINILVSAATMLAVLALWDRSQRPAPLMPSTVTASVTGAPTRTQPPAPTATPHLYTVLPGDTLGGIAAAFDVDLDELARLNGITDPNSLAPDMVLVIPPSDTAAESTSLVRPTVTPAEGEVYPWPRIEAVLAPGDLAKEAVRIVNEGSAASLSGWKLIAPNGESYTFGDFTLAAGGAVLVHTGAGDDTPIDLFWNLAEPVWAGGGEALLMDARAFLRSAFAVPE